MLVSACAGEDLPQNSLEPAGPIARDIDGLWNLVFWIAVVVFVLVEGALVLSVIRHRRRRNESRPAPKQIHGNTRLEIVWTVIPALLLITLAVPTIDGIFDIRSEPKGDRIDITVTGHQWWWEFEYPEGFVTANELHIPAGRTVYLTLQSADVIHSFWVPRLAGKRDLVPGRTNFLTLIADEPTPPGEPLLGQCGEFCGLAHADMRIRVFVETPAAYSRWTDDQTQPATIPVDGPGVAGFEVFTRVCSACHAIAGTPYAARLAPDLTHFASRTTFAAATQENNDDNLRTWLRNPPGVKPMTPGLNDVSAGRILGMPDFGLSEGEIDALVALLRGLE